MKRNRKMISVVCGMLLIATALAIPDTTTIAQDEFRIAKPETKFVPNRLLVKYRSESFKSQKRELLAAFNAYDAGELQDTGVHILQLPETANEEAVAAIFAGQPEVEFAELDRVLAPDDMIPNDPNYSSEWHLTKIAAPAAWSTTTGTGNVVVAICDTGVDGTHPDLAAKMVPGWNVYDNNSNTSDVYGHGTKVAGTVAASTNNSQGVAAVAWGCMIMPVRVSNASGSATLSAIANGITYAANNGARVANVSYKATGSATVSSAASYMQSRGGVVTVSSGNYGQFDATADDPYLLTVSATDPSDNIYSWSDTGNNIDVAAPGTVYTTLRGGGYGSASGTSFSAPIVAGIAALALSTNLNLTGAEVQQRITQYADDKGAPGWDTSFGYGRVNALRSVNGAGGGDTTAPSVAISSPSNGNTVSGTVTVQAAASDNVGVASVSFKVDGNQQAVDTTSPYSFSWNTTTVANGSHTLTATATDAAGNSASSSVSVTVNNSAADTTAPTVVITSPADGSTAGNIVTVTVNAADNVGVVRVELFVDGQWNTASTTAPFTTKWNAKRATRGAHTLQCRAYDAAGNVGASGTITVYR